MTQTYNVNVEPTVMSRFNEYCEHEGLSPSAALNMFIFAVLRDKHLPVEVSSLNELDTRIADMNNGENIVRKSIEELEAMENG